jgi:membrane protein
VPSSGRNRTVTTPNRAVDAAMARYAHTRDRLDTTVAGRARRRIVEVNLTNQALILGALGFTALLPVLVSLASVVPLGGPESGELAQRLGLSAQATQAVQQLFPARDTVRSSTTLIGTALAVVSAFSWPAALQRGYELAWGLPSLGWHALWRPILWLATLLCVGAAAGGSAPLVTGWLRTALLVVIGLPLVILWAWWTQRLLLGGRVAWRLLLPVAVAIGTGLIALRLFAGFYLSTGITEHFRQYGPLGIVFVIFTWLVALSTVLLGGAVLGAVWHEHRLRRADPGAAEEPPAMGDAAPAPRT